MSSKVHAVDSIQDAKQTSMAGGKVMDVEGLIPLGWYTAFICLAAEIMVLSQLGNMFYMAYAGAAPTIIGCGEYEFSQGLDSNEICKQLQLLEGNDTCELKLQYDFKSVNVEFGYFCRDTRYVKDSISIQMIGVIVGSLLFGQMSDSYGRKPTLVLCLLGCAIFGFVSAYASDLLLLTVYRSAIGIFNGGQMATLLVYVIENIPKKDRMWITGFVLSWSPNVALFAIIAYFSGNWRKLAISTSALILPALVLCLIAYESPRWLIQRGRFDEAHNVLKKISRLNGRSHVNDNMITEVINREKEIVRDAATKRKEYYFYHLFHTRTLATYTLVLAYSFLAASITNYGLLFNMEKVSGSIYVNNIFLSLIRYVVNIANAALDYTVPCFGRRMAHTIPLAFSCIGFAVSFTLIVTGLNIELHILSRLATLLAFAMCSQTYITSGVASNELFPTQIRAICFAFLQVVSRAGVVISPQLFFISEYWIPAPYLAMFLFAFTDLILYLVFIPETKGRPLRDRLSTDGEHLQRSTPLAKCNKSGV